MLLSIRNVKLLKCVSLICLSPLFVFYSSLNYDILGDPGADSGDEEKAKRAEKYMA